MYTLAELAKNTKPRPMSVAPNLKKSIRISKGVTPDTTTRLQTNTTGRQQSESQTQRLKLNSSSQFTLHETTKPKYKQDSRWVPGFYCRPGPGMYELNNIDSLSQHERSRESTINNCHMLKGFYKQIGPKHRFTDFSKAQIEKELIKTFGTHSEESISMYDKLSIRPQSTQDFLHPSTEMTIKEMPPQSFTK